MFDSTFIQVFPSAGRMFAASKGGTKVALWFHLVDRYSGRSFQFGRAFVDGVERQWKKWQVATPSDRTLRTAIASLERDGLIAKDGSLYYVDPHYGHKGSQQARYAQRAKIYPKLKELDTSHVRFEPKENGDEDEPDRPETDGGEL